MTREEAARILDPETTAEALAEIEYYAGFSGPTAKVQAVNEACEIAVAALREQLTTNCHQLEPVTNRNGLTNGDRFRAMSDEELADGFAEKSCPPGKGIITCESMGTCQCKECWLKWLRKPAEVQP